VDIKNVNIRYPSAEQKTALTIFMPCVHGRRTAGVAASLPDFEIKVSGKTSTANIYYEHRYHGSSVSSELGNNVSTYEGDEIFSSPPDVMIVGREDNERGMIELWQTLSKIKPIVLCAYSGVFQSRFNWDAYRGVICCDLPSGIVGRYYDVPTIKYRPKLETETFPFLPLQISDKLAFRSYIQGLSSRFPRAFALHQKAKVAIEAAIPNAIVENIENLPLGKARELMQGSVATLHIKDEEGFGWSILESLCTGRPLIAHAGFSKNMAFNEWVIPDETCFLFKDEDDLIRIAKHISDPDRMSGIHQRTADYLRHSLKPAAFSADLLGFLRDLWKIEHARWIPGKPTIGQRRQIKPYSPNENPNFEQDYELAFDECLSVKKDNEQPIISGTNNMPISATFRFGGKLQNPETYGKSYLGEFQDLLNQYLHFKTGNILEWGAGHSTKAIVNEIEQRSYNGPKFFLTIDENEPYLMAVTSDVSSFAYLHPIVLSQVGETKGQDDAGSNYSSYPLTLGKKFDFIFIDGRRRVECAFISALLCHEKTIVVMHDYRRERYQSVTALYDIVKDTPQFRIMRLKPSLLQTFSDSLPSFSFKET
jgi:hypothetical protein